MKKNTPPAPPPTSEILDENLINAWNMVYAFQQHRIKQTYADYSARTDLFKFFFEHIYTNPEKRKTLEKRDAAFIRIARGRLLRMLTNAEFIEYLETVIALRRMTDRLDLATAASIAENKNPPGTVPLDEELYTAAFRSATSKTERLQQLDAVMKSYELCRRVIVETRFSLDEILRFTPKIFLRNSDLLTLCVTAYRVFSKNKPHLREYETTLRERETAYINHVFNGE